MCSAFGGLWPSKESIPQGLKPLFFWLLGRAKPKGLAYLEAKAETKAKIEALTKSRSKGRDQPRQGPKQR